MSIWLPLLSSHALPRNLRMTPIAKMNKMNEKNLPNSKFGLDIFIISLPSASIPNLGLRALQQN